MPEQKKFGLGFKGDDVRPDMIAVHVIMFVQLLLSENADFDKTDLVSYNVLPVSDKDGLIQWIEGATSVYEIMGLDNKFSQFLTGLKLGSAQDNFTRSTAIYSVLNYVLGIGDRHSENMLLTQQGHFFHIDFGFLFGKDPMRILKINHGVNKEMINAISMSRMSFIYTVLATLSFN